MGKTSINWSFHVFLEFPTSTFSLPSSTLRIPGMTISKKHHNQPGAKDKSGQTGHSTWRRPVFRLFSESEFCFQRSQDLRDAQAAEVIEEIQTLDGLERRRGEKWDQFGQQCAASVYIAFYSDV